MIICGLLALSGLLGIILSKHRWLAVVSASFAIAVATGVVVARQGDGLLLGAGTVVVAVAVFQMCYLLAAAWSLRRAATRSSPLTSHRSESDKLLAERS